MVNRLLCASIVLVILGLGFIISGVLLFALGDGIINGAVKKGCELRDGTSAFEAWRHPPVPLHISFYLFDLNDTDFFSNSTKIPFVRQRGPFVYTEVRTKNDVEQYDNGTISYHEDRNYTFNEALSCDGCDDKTFNITTVNIVYMALVNFLQTEHVDPIFRRIVGEFLAIQEKPYMQRTVKEFLWGYQDPLLKLLKEVFPKIVANDEVSVFYASVSGAGLNSFLINSGVDVHRNDSKRIKKVGNIERYNYDTKVSYWLTEYANMINGTDSTIWHPDEKPSDEVYIFSPDICRSLRLEYSESRTNTFGITNDRFVLPDIAFANIPENYGFCVNATNQNKTHVIQCLPTGLMSLKTCIKLTGSSISIPLPIIASNPHFLGADTLVKNAVNGLKPDESMHRSFMDVEPITGIVMNGSRRLQINLNVVNDPEISAIANLKPFVYPMMWLDEHAEIDQKSAKDFRSQVYVQMTILEAMKYIAISIGGILFVLVVVLIVRHHHRTNSTGTPFPALTADETSPLVG